MSQLRTSTLDGRRIAYHATTEFKVQIGYGKKGSYKNKWTFYGNLGQAVLYYNGLNIGNGYKKRLLMPSSKKPILAKQAS